jgi:hypothetical protein
VVINQVNKSWDCNKENMDAYCLEVRKLENKFYGLEFHHVVRDNNVAVDVLSKFGSTRAQVPASVFVHELHAPSIPELVSKAFRRAFYWPTALGYAEELVRRCQGCQYFAKQQHVPAYKLVTIPPTWPFACWGLNMIGPLPTAPGGFNRVLVAIDKFTKWIEVKPVTCPKADRVLDFLDELMHRYGLPYRIITDLGSNFNNHQFWEYCENSGIDVRYVSVAHPRANGHVERANGMVLDALKKWLHDAANSKGGKCIKELPNAL